MYHLAIECSGFRGSVASFDKERCLSEVSLASDASSVQGLAPAIAHLLERDRRASAEFLSVTTGPGSFTSLRVGLATAKMLGFAWRMPLVPICSLAAIASRVASELLLPASLAESPNAPAGGATAGPVQVVAVLNAFRKQVFAASWWCDSSGLRPIAAPQVINAGEWCASPIDSLRVERGNAVGIERQNCPVVLTGPGLELYAPEAVGMLNGGTWEPLEPNSRWLAPTGMWEPRASDVGWLGWRAFQSRRTVAPESLLANYVRASAAEEKAAGH